MKEHQKTWYQLSIVVAFIFVLFFSSIFLVEKTGQHLLGAVTYATGTNATITLSDDGDSIKTATSIVADIEINNLFNDTSNVYFYANYTNSTGQSMIGVSGTACAIEFEAGAAGQTGPFAMIENTTLNVWEYNRSFANNGTFVWNVTCSNTDAGTATVRAYDSVRIFGDSCFVLGLTYPNSIANNTILCDSNLVFTPAAGQSVISIQNNNITLDCNFTRIRGADAEVGINIGPYNGTIIKNCIFENYSIAINNKAGAVDTLLLFNNSFANLTVSSLNVSNIQNLTLRSNNFTNNTGSAIVMENITNTTITNNYFCNNGVPTIYNTSANYTAANNTFCVNLVVPRNNTINDEINYTFTVPSLGYQRTCDLLINNVNNSGRARVNPDVESAQNVTVNTTFFAANKFVWRVNCTDANNNNGISVQYNSTYGSCTVPTSGALIGASNITLCAGTYYLNETGMAINGRAGGIICNNTILKSNLSLSAINIITQASDARVVACYFSGFYKAIVAEGVLTNRLVIINNTFNNISNNAVNLKLHSNDNITNNSFRDVNTAIHMQNTYNHRVENNYVYNTSTGLFLKNATGTTIINNNFTNITSTGIGADTLTPLTNVTFFNYTISNNYFCGIANYVFFVQDYQLSSTLNDIVPANGFCNSTDATPNGAIARVMWSTEMQAITNSGPVDASDIAVRNLPGVVQSIEKTNVTGEASVVIIEFNISTDNNLTYLSPHQFVANASGSTKTVNHLVNESRTVQIGNQIIFNLSDPDALPNIPPKARAEALRAARAAAAATQQQVTEKAEEGKEEEEEEEVIEIPVNYTYALQLQKISIDSEVIYENNEVQAPLVFKDYESYVLSFVIENIGTGNISDFVFSLDVPPSIKIISQKISKDMLSQGEKATIIFNVESADILDAFSIKFYVWSTTHKEANLEVTLNTLLEEGKGELYSTRQKIIEETSAIIIKTYEILFLLFLIPLLLLLRATTIADDTALRRMIDDKKISEYWKIYVPEETYMKYDVFENVKPIRLEEYDIAKANHLAVEKKISYQLATAIIFAQHCLIPRVFTCESVSPEIRHQYPRIYFTSPLRNYKEDQLKRYIEKQQQAGFTNNEIRETLRNAQWSRDVIKKYLPPESDLNMYIEEQQKKGRSLGELRKELLDVKWNKAVVDKVIPKENVLKEYLTEQRRQGKTNAQIKAMLIKAGWEKAFVEKYINVESDLKAYITFQQHRGFSDEQIKTELVQKGWKKEIINKYIK